MKDEIVTENQDVNSEDNLIGEGEISPRSAVGAAALTLLMTGLGHIYCGQLVIGLAWAAVGSLSGVVSLWALASENVGIAASSLPMAFVSVAAAVHAWCSAKNCSREYRLKSYNRWYVYLLLLAIASFGAAGHGLIVRSTLIQAYVTPVNDMNPTLQRGDRFLVDKMAFRDSLPQVGEVVVFKNPAEPQRTYIKRIVALAGDTVEVRDGRLLVNDQPVGEENRELDDFGPEVVPRYNCFVVGDNLVISRDSRHFGPVPNAAVLGKATTLFWPQESWSRLGRIE